MHTRTLRAAATCLAFATTTAWAEPAPNVQQQGVTAGFGVLVGDSEYAGEGSRVIAIPIVTYESERFFVQGPQAGVHLYRSGRLTLDATLSARFSGWDADDLGVRELAERGVDRALLEDRDFSADLGFAASWLGTAGKLELAVKSDVLGASEGQEFSVEYTARLPMAGGQLLPGARISYWSDKLANYYYGTFASEEQRGVSAYRPDAFVMPSLRLGYLRPMGENWQAYGAIDYRFLPDEIKDSPFVERGVDGSATLTLAFTREF